MHAVSRIGENISLEYRIKINLTFVSFSNLTPSESKPEFQHNNILFDSNIYMQFSVCHGVHLYQTNAVFHGIHLDFYIKPK